MAGGDSGQSVAGRGGTRERIEPQSALARSFVGSVAGDAVISQDGENLVAKGWRCSVELVGGKQAPNDEWKEGADGDGEALMRCGAACNFRSLGRGVRKGDPHGGEVVVVPRCGRGCGGQSRPA